MRISSEHIYVLDIETDRENSKGLKREALDRSRNKIVDIGIKNLNTGQKLSLSEDKHLDILHYIQKYQLKLICHNGLFDLTNIMFHYGIDLADNLYCDTLVLAKVLFANDEGNDLETLAIRHLGVKPWKKVASKTNNLEYLFNDLDHTGDLSKVFLDMLSGNKLKLYQHLMEWQRAFIKICYNGVPLDLGHLEEAKQHYTKLTNDVLDKLKQIKDINWRSTKQVSEYLYDELNISPNKQFNSEKTGKPSSSAKALWDIINRGEDHNGCCKLLLEYKIMDKRVTFCKDWTIREVNGRIYPYINMSGTKTGRTSSSEPNIQQVPRDKVLRNCFNNTDPNILVGEFDYSQIELRVAAWMTGDKAMKQAYINNEDIHQKTGEAIFGKRELTKDERSSAKQVNFGFVYGRQAKGFHDQMITDFHKNITIEEAEKWRANFFAQYCDLEDYYKRIEIECMEEGGVSTPTGRFRATPDIYSHNKYLRSSALRYAVNTPIQSFASDILVSSAVDVANIDGVTVCATIHDAILVEVDLTKHSKEHYEKLIKQVMEQPKLFKDFNINFDVPLIADCDWGAWGGK